MDPLALNAQALAEPWRLWTGHLTHYGWEHALANAVALLVPLLLVPGRDRPRLALSLLFLAPLLSLLLLPGLHGAEYRGASGLACALWALAGLHTLRVSRAVGLLLLAGLALKLGLEAGTGAGLLVRAEGWSTLPAAHLWGAALGLATAVTFRLRSHPSRGGVRVHQRG